MFGRNGEIHFDFQEVFRRPIDFFKGLLTCVWHGLHDGGGGWGEVEYLCGFRCRFKTGTRSSVLEARDEASDSLQTSFEVVNEK